MGVGTEWPDDAKRLVLHVLFLVAQFRGNVYLIPGPRSAERQVNFPRNSRKSAIENGGFEARIRSTKFAEEVHVALREANAMNGDPKRAIQDIK